MDTEGRGGERGSRVTLARRRAYSLLDGSTFIVVNHTVRLDGPQFTAAKGGPQQRTLRSEAHLKLYCTCTTSRVIPTRRLGRAAPSRRRSRSKVVPQCRNRGFDPEIAQIFFAGASPAPPTPGVQVPYPKSASNFAADCECESCGRLLYSKEL